MKPIIQHGFSRRWLGVGMSLVAAAAAYASTDVTFQIDMAPVSPAVPTGVSISGSFNGWPNPATSTLQLINVGGTVWSNTFTIADAPGTVESCKFQYEAGDNWEGDPNRQFILGTGTQDLPLTSWNVKTNWPPAPTNSVTFQVDMSALVVLGSFTNYGTNVTVSGDFEGWDGGKVMTNNPALPGIASNIYSGIFDVVGFPPTGINYKFRADGGWESVPNRTASVTNGQVLPLVYYNNNSVSDLLLQPTAVKFSVYVPNGTVLANGGTFTKGVDNVAVNGAWVPWWGWGVNAAPAEYLMTESEITDVYTNTLIIPKGAALALTYKYGIDGLDNENGQETNHIRYVRTYGSSYVLPQDVWSLTVVPPAPYPNPGLASTNIVEPSFGYLNAGAPSGGNIPITWLGRPAVLLQSSSSLSGGVWTDVIGTDGLQATNIPNAGGNQFFRLKKNL
ncbi:MAG: hypothetical protein PHY43_06805 [Verrucomicrobiales bacterium]|nr:hypothetical protein [Verrucomicrobiales bacterium]